MGASSPGEYKSDINITPLVDVVLVLLIIFMVITPLLQMGYDVKVPPKINTPQNTPPPTDLMIVSLTPQNKIYLNKDEVNAQTLALRLTEIQESGQPWFLSWRRRGKLRRGRRVMDPCRNSGPEHRHRDGDRPHGSSRLSESRPRT
jgi:biopolymer transport protein ExbD